MPQVLIAAAIGAGVYAGYRLMRLAQAMVADAAQRVDEQVHQAGQRNRIGEKDLGALEYDPESGVYRPRT
jgi:hypothetical protein